MIPGILYLLPSRLTTTTLVSRYVSCKSTAHQLYSCILVWAQEPDAHRGSWFPSTAREEFAPARIPSCQVGFPKAKLISGWTGVGTSQKRKGDWTYIPNLFNPHEHGYVCKTYCHLEYDFTEWFMSALLICKMYQQKQCEESWRLLNVQKIIRTVSSLQFLKTKIYCETCI